MRRASPDGNVDACDARHTGILRTRNDRVLIAALRRRSIKTTGVIPPRHAPSLPRPRGQSTQPSDVSDVLEALAVHDGGPALVVLGLGDPHLLERGEPPRCRPSCPPRTPSTPSPTPPPRSILKS